MHADYSVQKVDFDLEEKPTDKQKAALEALELDFAIHARKFELVSIIIDDRRPKLAIFRPL